MLAFSCADRRKRSALSSPPNSSIRTTSPTRGHSSWTPDASQPGYGNFCFGHFNATAIEKATPNDSANPTQYTVDYRYEVLGIPEWVRTPTSMRALPKLAADTSIQSATAILFKGADGGWTVDSPHPAQ